MKALKINARSFLKIICEISLKNLLLVLLKFIGAAVKEGTRCLYYRCWNLLPIPKMFCVENRKSLKPSTFTFILSTNHSWSWPQLFSQLFTLFLDYLSRTCLLCFDFEVVFPRTFGLVSRQRTFSFGFSLLEKSAPLRLAQPASPTILPVPIFLLIGTM